MKAIKAIVIAALIVLALIGAGWKWGSRGVSKAVGWTWIQQPSMDGGSSVPDRWTWQ
jgi:hypothetical protein